jgi:hypothetical protein
MVWPIFLDLAWRQYRRGGLIHRRTDLTAAISVGASQRIRP